MFKNKDFIIFSVWSFLVSGTSLTMLVLWLKMSSSRNSAYYKINKFSGKHDGVIKWNIFRFAGHLCGKSPVTGEFHAQRPVTRIFDVLFDLRRDKRLSKQSWGW